tara:strand:- start:1935 stop:2348 length:414 start_codon:yes stop_codon:yes gene_type:complete
MNNEVFELYKKDSLAKFLDTLKTKPEQKFVYVLQHPPANMNILSASEFGQLVICLPMLSQIVFSSSPFIHKMSKNLRDFRKQDYVLCLGDPAIIALSTPIISEMTNGMFNLLKWDKREYKYYPVSIDYYQKDDIAID